MRVLVTSSRTPFALDMVRKLALCGHSVYASDTYPAAPGSHSRYLAGHFVTPAPDRETEGFVTEVARIAESEHLDAIAPAFEEAFFLAALRDRLDGVALYTGRFDQLARLHDKSSFQRLVTGLGLPTPQTLLARSQEELREDTARFPRFFARAAFSRGGVDLLTNTGPLAGQLKVGDCRPTRDSPWLVQEFVDGPMVCTYSTLHGGRVTAHCAYRAPRQWEHSTGIEFLSIDGDETLRAVEAIGAALGYTGQLSLDLIDTGDGLAMIECNPRATDGVLLMEPDDLSDGILEPERELTITKPGRRVELDFAVFAQIFSEGIRELPGSVHDLARVAGADRGWHDLVPELYSFLAFAHHERIARREHTQVFEAMAADMCWNGEPIAGMSGSEANALRQLGSERAGG